MKLATVDGVLSRMSVSSALGGQVTSAGVALDAATVILANMLESQFDRVAVADYYSPDFSRIGKSAKLYLSRMFLATDEAITVSYGAYSGNAPADAYTDILPIEYSADNEAGSIKLDNIPAYGKMSIKVTYTSGFYGESDFNIPDWLKEAAITAAVYVMHTQTAAHGKKDILDISPEYRRLIYVMVQQHMRPRMNCLFAEASFTES